MKKCMNNKNFYIKQLQRKLSVLDPYLVLLFGSYATGEPNQDSDLDVFVVLNDNTMPKSFKEKQELYFKVSEHTHEIAKKIPIDLIVFTKPMFEQFKTLNSSFSKEILKNGIILYETDNSSMA